MDTFRTIKDAKQYAKALRAQNPNAKVAVRLVAAGNHVAWQVVITDRFA